MLYVGRPRSVWAQPIVGRCWACACILTVHTAKEIEHQREHQAEQDRSRQRKVKGKVAATIDDVAGQAADRKVGSPQQHQQQADQDQTRADKDDELAQAEHSTILMRRLLLEMYRR